MKSVHLYEDQYVNGLQWKNRLLLLAIGFLCGMGLFGAWKGSTYAQSLNTALQAAEAVIQGLQTENAEYKDALKDYTETKAKLAALIRKTNPKLSASQAERIAALQMKYARQKKIPLEIAAALPIQESGYNPGAVSYTGCCLGLYQLNWKVLDAKYGLTNPKKTFDIETNIRVGLQLLADHHKRYGNYETALGRYYGSTVPEENRRYAAAVLAKSRYVAKYIA